MAIRSTVHKADLSIADMDRHHYADHSLTLARHPSETEERLMVRLVAFAMHADERLTPAGGISTEDEPDFWHLDDTGSIRLWLQVGLPDERLLRKASGRSDEVVLYAYGGRKAEAWRQDNATALARLKWPPQQKSSFRRRKTAVAPGRSTAICPIERAGFMAWACAGERGAFMGNVLVNGYLV